MNSPPDELIDFIKTGSKFIVAGHKEPDGDCVGSQLALRSALRRLGKEAVVCSAGPFKRTELKNYSEQFTGIPSDYNKSNSKVIIVDCSGKERTGSIQELLDEFPCAIIDHHAASTHSISAPDAPVYTDADSPSCTLLVEKLITALGLELTAEEAQALLFGLCTDTGFLRHLTDKDAQTLEAAARMVKSGASPKTVYNIMNGGKSFNSRVIMGRILSRIESHFGGKLILSYETFEEFSAFGFENRDSENLNKMLLSIEGVQAIVIIRQEYAEDCTVSLRSVDNVDVAQIAASLGGGGHRNASGLTLKGDIPYIKQIMLNTFKNIFD
ncbi:MAG: bifunctional oligoribonuclease/PAP phosphatase NrnA [Treponema sp.]|nr:bifunctional oligoribonuclease/PAP phosphatase NrnA [Treponema sp.]